MDEQKGGKPNPGTDKDKRLSENKEAPPPKNFGKLPGTGEMGSDQQDAANSNDADHASAWAKHNQGAAGKVPPAQQKSYAAELGEALSPHATEQGRRFTQTRTG